MLLGLFCCFVRVFVCFVFVPLFVTTTWLCTRFDWISFCLDFGVIVILFFLFWRIGVELQIWVLVLG